MKFDIVKIGKIISDIKKYQKDLEEQKINSPATLKRKDKFYTCSMLIFSLTNSAIDLGNEIISTKKFGMPHSYSEIFEILSNRKLMDEKTKNDLLELVRVRNIIAHRYFMITPKKLFNSLRKLESMKRFVKKIEKLAK